MSNSRRGVSIMEGVLIKDRKISQFFRPFLLENQNLLS